MGAILHINDEYDAMNIVCAYDEPCIWIRAGYMGSEGTVSLDLNPTNLDALELAINQARAQLVARGRLVAA